MDKIISKLQKKSDHEKNTIAFGVAGFITVLLIIFWTSNFGTTISSISKDATLADTSPVGFFRDNINKLFDFNQASEKIAQIANEASDASNMSASALSSSDDSHVSASTTETILNDIKVATTTVGNVSTTTKTSTTSAVVKKK